MFWKRNEEPLFVVPSDSLLQNFKQHLDVYMCSIVYDKPRQKKKKNLTETLLSAKKWNLTEKLQRAASCVQLYMWHSFTFMKVILALSNIPRILMQHSQDFNNWLFISWEMTRDI